MSTAAVSEYQRFVYASRAAFPTNTTASGIDPEIARILMQSRRNNPNTGLVGALYFADGCFFQCLEGWTAAIEQLYARLHHDKRHTDLKILGRQAINTPTFASWAMKYVPNASEVKALMTRHGHTEFNPYKFDNAMISGMVELLLNGPNVASKATMPLSHDALVQRVQRNEIVAVAALAVSVLGLLAALFI